MRTPRRAGKRTPFTHRMWDSWLARLAGPDPYDPQFRYLSEGIRQFRAALEKKEPKEIT